jgi:hypothetical protein
VNKLLNHLRSALRNNIAFLSNFTEIDLAKSLSAGATISYSQNSRSHKTLNRINVHNLRRHEITYLAIVGELNARDEEAKLVFNADFRHFDEVLTDSVDNGDGSIKSIRTKGECLC